jgi:hypothetical protein
MKILLISPVPTHPIFRGNATRILNLADFLNSRGHTVDFAYCAFEPGDRSAMQAYWADHYHEFLDYQQPFCKECIRGTALPIPDRMARWMAPRAWTYQRIDHFYDAAFNRFLKDLQAREQFDAAMVSYVFFSKALEAFDETVLKVLDTHDVFADRNRLFRQNGLPPEWFYTSAEQECIGLRRADTVIAIQHSDELYMKSRLGSESRVIEVGHLYGPGHASPGSDHDRVHFMGSNGTLNIQALQWFLDRVWPIVTEQTETARLHVYGSIAKAFRETQYPKVVYEGIVRSHFRCV